MGQKLLIKLVNLGGPPVPTGPPASNKGIWGGAGVVSGGPPKILELHYSATVFQHCAYPIVSWTRRGSQGCLGRGIAREGELYAGRTQQVK